MRIVYTPGCYDLLHIGHVKYFEAAKALGDVLIVGVASDAVVFEDKGQYPIIPYQDRVAMVRAIKHVDVAEVYYHLDFIPHLNLFSPDVLVVGEFWGAEERHKKAEQWVKDNDKRIVSLPYYPYESTSAIKMRVMS